MSSLAVQVVEPRKQAEKDQPERQEENQGFKEETIIRENDQVLQVWMRIQKNKTEKNLKYTNMEIIGNSLKSDSSRMLGIRIRSQCFQD